MTPQGLSRFAGERRSRVGWTYGACLAVLLLASCASTPEADYLRARASFVALHQGYNRFLAQDNAQVRACYALHPELAGDAAREACPPWLEAAHRERAAEIVAAAYADFEAVAPLVGVGLGGDPQRVADLIGTIEARALALVALYGDKP